MTVSRSFIAIWKEWHKSNLTYYPFKFQAILILEDGQVINGLMRATFDMADSDKEQLIQDFST